MLSKVILGLLLVGSMRAQASESLKLKIRVEVRPSNKSKWVQNVTTVSESGYPPSLLATTSAIDDTISAFKLNLTYQCDAVIGNLTVVPGAGDVQQVYSLSNCK